MAWNCTTYPALQENPDVAGVGVLVGFLATAYITLILCIIKYLIDHNPEPTKHPLDRLILDGLRKLIGKTPLNRHFRAKKSDFWNGLLKNSVISFSDQQVLTSISLLIGGISQFRYGLHSYHWQNIVNLAWFSSVTHLTTLTTLRYDFHENHAQRSWRIIAMSITGIMLLIGVCSLGYYDPTAEGSGDYALPAWCLFHVNRWKTDYTSYNSIYITISSLILGISYFSRIILLFPTLSTGVKKRIYTHPAIKFKDWVDACKTGSENDSSPLGWMLFFKYNLIYTIFTMTIVTVDLSTSMLWEILWLLFVLCWSTIRIAVARIEVKRDYPDVIDNENVWGFGQVVAVMLLVLPFVGFYEAIYDTTKSKPSSTSTNLGPLPLVQVPPTNSGGNSNASINEPHEDTFDSELYSKPWLPRIISLQFGLALVVLGDLLYFFCYSDNIVWLTGTATSSHTEEARSLSMIALQYFIWFSLNFGIVFVFTFCTNKSLGSSAASTALPNQVITRRSGTLLWIMIVFSLLAVSVFFDVYTYYHHSFDQYSKGLYAGLGD